MVDEEVDPIALADHLANEMERLMFITKWKAFAAASAQALVFIIIYHLLRINGVIP